MKCFSKWLVVLAALSLATPAVAHKPSDSYLTLRSDDGADYIVPFR